MRPASRAPARREIGSVAVRVGREHPAARILSPRLGGTFPSRPLHEAWLLGIRERPVRWPDFFQESRAEGGSRFRSCRDPLFLAIG